MDQGEATPTVWNEGPGRSASVPRTWNLSWQGKPHSEVVPRQIHTVSTGKVRYAERKTCSASHGVRLQHYTLERSSHLVRSSKNVPYRQAVGCLKFLTIFTRPDIAFAVCCLAHFCEQPLSFHRVAAKRTHNPGITFGISQDLQQIGYTDSDLGGCRETRQSTSGYVFMVAVSLVCRLSKKKSIVATCFGEAEHIASCSAAKEAVLDIASHWKHIQSRQAAANSSICG